MHTLHRRASARQKRGGNASLERAFDALLGSKPQTLRPLVVNPRSLPQHYCWEFFSTKLGRPVIPTSDLERDAFTHLEMDPEINWYCEQPLAVTIAVGGKRIKTTFDVASRGRSSRITLAEIKPVASLGSRRVQERQLPAQRAFCLEYGFDHRIWTDEEIRANAVLLENRKDMIGYLAARATLDLNDVVETIRDRLSTSENVTLSELISRMPGVPAEYVRTAAYRMLHAGEARAEDLGRVHLSDALTLRTPS